MKPNWKQIMTALSGTIGSVIVAAVLNRQRQSDTTVNEAQSATPPPQASGLRATAINLVSDILAETYRKIRHQEAEQRRRRR